MRWLLVALAALVTAAVVGTIALRSGDSKSTRAVGQTTADVEVGAPDGVAATSVMAGGQENGAADAARRAVESTGRVVEAGFISRRDIIAEFTTPEFGAVLSDETSSQVTNLLLQLDAQGADPADLAVREVPIAVVGQPARDGTTQVRVWSVLVVTLAGAAPARAVWRTSTLDMRLVDGEWLVDGWASELGPAPALPPDQAVSAGSEVAALLAADVTGQEGR